MSSLAIHVNFCCEDGMELPYRYIVYATLDPFGELVMNYPFSAYSVDRVSLCRSTFFFCLSDSFSDFH